MDIVEEFPERADYFSDPSRLVFNWHLKVNKNYKHILDDFAEKMKDVAVIEKPAKLEGRNMTMFLEKKR